MKYHAQFLLDKGKSNFTEKNSTMNTTIISAEINSADIPFFQSLLKKLNAKNISIGMDKEPAKMTKKEYFSMIDKARNQKGKEVTIDELKSKILSL
ncbi:MAG: hypothetical protein Q4G08_09550 [Capnocytophaga sp.]|nr:hypothetical protein [Capnocytophaga sp.]